ncbi:MAG: oligosaccharide flippase family protein [Prevotella sp.]|nr:oligosaccharide flippase family protein [Prevotella sp.]
MEKTKHTGGYSHILKYAGIFGGVQGLSILVGILRNKLVATLLGPDGMGLISLFTSSLSLVSNSTNLGLSVSGIRNLSNAYETNDQPTLNRLILVLRSWTLLAALLGVFVCFVLAPWLNDFTFTWGDHTLHFMLLSPIVGLMAITACETTILKATRQLKRLAALSLLNVFLSLFISVPLFYFFRAAAIIPSMFILSLLQMLLIIIYSFRLYPIHIFMRKDVLGEGLQMVQLGVFFVLAGIMGSGADFLIRSYLNTEASLTDVGLYNAGYMMMMTCASTVFASLESDYFPRLSAISSHQFTMNQTINRQVEITFLFLVPILITFVITLPILIPLLYTDKFLPVLGMMQIMVFEMYIRSVRLPIEYIPLAKGDSKSFLFLETVYFSVLALLVIQGFKAYGLMGAGIGMVVAGIFDLILVLVYARWRYNYRFSMNAGRYVLMFSPLCCAAFALSFIHNPWLYWPFGGAVSIISLSLSIFILRKKTNVWQSLTDKIKRKMSHS